VKFELDAVKRPFFKPGFPNPLKEVGTGAHGDECSHPQKDRKVNCHYFNRCLFSIFWGGDKIHDTSDSAAWNVREKPKKLLHGCASGGFGIVFFKYGSALSKT